MRADNTRSRPVQKDGPYGSATVFYDADCQICVGTVRRFERVLARRAFEMVPLQAPGVSVLLGVPDEQLLTEMRLRLRDGTVVGGADAVVEIARRIWWAWPLWVLSGVPGAMRPMRAIYRWVARHRSCTSGACDVHVRAGTRPTDVLPLIILPIVALMLAPLIPRWGFMWAMAFALYAGCKWLTFRQAVARMERTSGRRTLGYLFAWPGMDAMAFLSDRTPVERSTRSEWIGAGINIAFGMILIWIVVRPALSVSPLVAGWIGMAGAVLILHFGTFHVVSLVWRRAGINAMPVMRKPLRSTSLGEFWGRRWNTAFHELASRLTFRPLRQFVGVTGATLLAFVASGLIHELVISVPARGAYGLPTGYFVLQGLGVAGERTPLARRLGLGSGWRGWLFTVLVTAGPAFWLFPPPFVRNVILPMLAVIGAA